MAADVIPTTSLRTTGVWRGATAATAEVLTRPWRPYRRYEDLDVGLGAVPLGSSRRVANVSCARRSFTACEARFELEQQRPVTERSLAVQSADILAHHTPEALTNLLIEVSVKVLVRSLTAEFDPDKYTDDYRTQVLDLIGRKAAGEEFELPAVEAEKPKIVDMMVALEASVEAAKAARGRHPTARPAPNAAAKKPAKRAAKPRARKT